MPAWERRQLKGYPAAEFVGFCDRSELDKVGSQYPGAFKVADYPEAFASRADQFDAVIVETPDFHHAPMMLTAMKHRKHIYGQKPLVHQLDELRMIKQEHHHLSRRWKVRAREIYRAL